MKISFNLRLGYTQSLDCIDKIEELGGSGRIVVGGSWYSGTKEQIEDLIIYMGQKDYDMASMAINEDPHEATQKRIEQLKKDGII